MQSSMNISRPFVVLKRVAFAFALAVCLSLSAAVPTAWALDPTPAATGPVDLNTATDAQLEKLPGVGPATAKAIVAARPFNSVDDLAKVKGIGPAKMAALKGAVTVGGSKAPAAGAPVAVPATPPPAMPTAPAAPKVAVPTPTVTMPAPRPSAAPSTGTPVSPPAAAATKLAAGQKVNLNTASQAELEALPGVGPVKAQKIIQGRPYATPEDVMKVPGIKQGIFAKIKDSVVVK